ncbi:hypothetical protein GCM10011609_34280 [Lentzea pudingi]|uniref:Uncharacterized protein n=1 Tax=Lentzea pudingi TaxID=1789439 RepID=A0ABQ2HWS6_9PSEU|nr:hypothetical protein [Lentzea pudingi]GGM93972.1 hypothetical protein GCM10011609_34280 [Lentzea pudingi]
MHVIDTPASPHRDRLRPAMVAARRSAVVLVATSAVFAGLVQGTAQAAPPHSVAVKQDEFVLAVNGKGCRVGHTYRVNASSVREAENLAKAYGRQNGTEVGNVRMQTHVSQSNDTVTVTAYSDLRGVAAQNCIAQKVEPHKGRNLASVPRWAQQVLATLAGLAVALVVATFATAAVAAVTGGTDSVVAAIVGGCLGGVAGTYVTQRITPDKPKTDLAISDVLTACVVSGASAGQLGPGIRRAETWVVENATITVMRQAIGSWAAFQAAAAAQSSRNALARTRGRLGV